MQARLDNSQDRVVALFGAACAATEIGSLCTEVLPHLLQLEQVDAGFMYIADGRFAAPAKVEISLTEQGEQLDHEAAHWLEQLCTQGSEARESLSVQLGDSTPLMLQIYPLTYEGRVLGITGIKASPKAPEAWSATTRCTVLDILGHVIDRLADETSTQRRLRHLSTYARVSSMLGKSGDLSELLEIALYSSMEAVDGEAASVLLLDEEKENFRFYNVEGTAEPLLSGASFPADEGFAGHVLTTMEAEIVNDVTTDARFYDQIDLTSGFQTRNLIAVPLIAGDERIGVLEVLNRKNGEDFTPDDRLLLVSVADEMAYTIRNATMFDFLAAQYCKRRQGEPTCDACEQPIESWVPCARYRT